MIRVLVVDDQPLARAGIGRILQTEPDVEVVGECEDGSEVPATVARIQPDVVVMDVRMKHVDGTEATRLLARSVPSAPVLILTTFDDDEVVATALSAGAAGFVLKDAPGEQIVAAVRAVAAGDVWLDPSILPAVLDTYRRTVLPRAAESVRLDQLTEREREVLRLVGRGANNQEIAAELHIGESTVKTHVGNILSKLHLRDRAAAIVLAFDHGLARPGEPG